MNLTKFQIGKSGITPGVLESLSLAFKNHKQVRISALKSTGRDKQSIINIANELCEKLPKTHTYSYRILGFTIILRKHSLKKQ